MATSGSFASNAYSGIRNIEFHWHRAGYDIGGNNTTIYWELKGGGSNPTKWYKSGNFKVVIDGEVVFSSATRIELYAGTVVASGHKVIHHNADGSRSFGASIEAGIYSVAVNCSGSGSWALDSLPKQAYLVSVPNFNDENNVTIYYSNPAGHGAGSLQACIADTSGNIIVGYRDVDKGGSSYTFNFSTAERNALRNSTKNSNTKTIRYYLKTVIGGTTYYSTADKTLTIINATPTISNAAIVDTGTSSTALTGDSSKIINAHNYLKASFTATGLKGATIASTSITCGNQVINSTSGNFNNATSGTFVFRVKDSRGNTNSYTLTKTLIPYIPLTCNFDTNNPTAEGDMTFKISGNYYNGSFGTTNNTLTVQWRYKENDGAFSAWQTPTPTIEDGTYYVTPRLEGLNYQSVYTFEVKASDKIYNHTLSKSVRATPIFDWGERDFNINGTFKIYDVPFLDLVYPVGSIYMSVNYFDPGTVFGGTWERLMDRFLLGSGATYASGQTGGSATKNISHNHNVPTATNSWENPYTGIAYTADNYRIKNGSLKTDSAGSTALNIMPPYLVVNMWKRVA